MVRLTFQTVTAEGRTVPVMVEAESYTLAEDRRLTVVRERFAFDIDGDPCRMAWTETYRRVTALIVADLPAVAVVDSLVSRVRERRRMAAPLRLTMDGDRVH